MHYNMSLTCHWMQAGTSYNIWSMQINPLIFEYLCTEHCWYYTACVYVPCYQHMSHTENCYPKHMTDIILSLILCYTYQMPLYLKIQRAGLYTVALHWHSVIITCVPRITMHGDMNKIEATQKLLWMEHYTEDLRNIREATPVIGNGMQTLQTNPIV